MKFLELELKISESRKETAQANERIQKMRNESMKNKSIGAWFFGILCLSITVGGLLYLPEELSLYKTIAFGVIPAMFAGICAVLIGGSGEAEASVSHQSSLLKMKGNQGYTLFIAVFFGYLLLASAASVASNALAAYKSDKEVSKGVAP